MKQDNLFWNRYFWWPVATAADWIGAFINQCPPAKKVFQSPYVQGHPWPRKFHQIRKRVKAEPDQKGAPHSEVKTFNHPRR